jgi:His-Xaa-Ser system radical SAM maturase HxsB
LAISSKHFDEFVGKRLNPSDPVYFDLQAKHLLADETSRNWLEPMASKYFTKKSFLDGFTKLHIFVTTLRCNQSCPYCQVSRAGEAANCGAYDMSPEVLEQSIRLMLSTPSRRITMEFQGGESLIRFDILKEAVKRTKELNENIGKEISYVICTNLTLLTDEHLDWCKDNDVLISTSLDGPEYLHNKNRPFGNGSPSYDSVIRNIRFAQEALGKQSVSALMTTTRESLKYPKEIVDEYLKIGMGSIFVRELNPYGFAAKSAAALGYSAEDFFKFYRTILYYVIDINRQGRNFSEGFASFVLTKALTPLPIGFVDLQSPAGAGFGVCLYNYDGEMYVSDEARMLAETGDPVFRMGNVLENTYDELFFGETMQSLAAAACNESLPGCSDCAYQAFCGADPVRNYRTQGDMFGNRVAPGSFCHKNKLVIRHLMQLADSADDELSRILWAWITHEDVNRLNLGN